MGARGFFMAAAVFIHLGILLLGGLLFTKSSEEVAAETIAEVELIAETSEDEEKKEEVQEQEEQQDPSETPPEEDMEVRIEAPPSMADMSVQIDPGASVPELQALSLSILEGALATGGAGGGFGWGVNLGSGGRIGGTGTALSEDFDENAIFEVADLDQRPRALFQVPPRYPPELRRKKLEGTVYVLFVVDREGRVVDPQIERSSDVAFEQPVIEAVKRWRFEPGTRNGQKIQSRMRLPIRFSAPD